MKQLLMRLFILTSLLVSTAVYASSKPIESCRNYGQYINTGWTIHPSSEFEQISQEMINKVNTGLGDGSIVYDLSGILMNHETPSGEPLFLNVAMWDVLATPKMEMFGDIAIIKDPLGDEEIVEVRWYDGKTRNLVINSNTINCMTEDAPYVENSVL